MNCNKEFLRFRLFDPNADILLERSHLTSFTSRIDIIFCTQVVRITKCFPVTVLPKKGRSHCNAGVCVHTQLTRAQSRQI